MRIVFCLFCVLLLFCCAVNDLTPRYITTITAQDTLTTDIQYDKVCYTDTDQTFFCLSRDANTFTIYKNNTIYNKIGGSGHSSDNFLNLADICIGNDNMLYALDTFDQSIKRFDTHGRFSSSVKIDYISSPSRFTASSYGDFFVYDSHAKEIYVLDSFSFDKKYTFGKFQINHADVMYLVGDALHVYDGRENTTTIFMINGLLIDTFPGLVLYARVTEDTPFIADFSLEIAGHTVRFPQSDVFFDRNSILMCKRNGVVRFILR